MKHLYYILIILLFSTTLIFAQSQGPQNTQQTQQQEKKVLTEEEVRKIDPKQIEKQKIERRTGGETPKEEKIEIIEQERKQQEIIIRKYKPGTLFLESSGFKMGTSLAPVKEQQHGQGQTGQQQQQTKKAEAIGINFTGYCEPVDSYKVSIYPVPATLICLIKDLSDNMIKLTGKFKPDIGNQLSLTFDGAKLNGCLQLKEFYIVRASDYSPNLYSDVDRKIWENALLRATTKTGQDISAGVVERLKEPNKKTIVISEGNVSIVEEQKEDTWKDFKKSIPYIAGANLTEAISKEILSAYGGRIPPIFYVNKGELYLVEGVCVLSEGNQTVKK